MHGDFSRWYPRQLTNQSGILQQQGRVLLDADVNAATLITVGPVKVELLVLLKSTWNLYRFREFVP